jgi:hypothetical protein
MPFLFARYTSMGSLGISFDNRRNCRVYPYVYDGISNCVLCVKSYFYSLIFKKVGISDFSEYVKVSYLFLLFSLLGVSVYVLFLWERLFD